MRGTSSCADRPRILVVDDVELNRILTSAVLNGAAYEVVSVESGGAAIEALERDSYDLVLMDLDMPDLGGHAAAAAIRERGDSVVRIAALTSHADADSRRRSTEVGMAAHIARPVQPPALLDAIERVLRLPVAERRAEVWQRRAYDEWAGRLGESTMLGALRTLRDHLCNLLRLIAAGDRDRLLRLAHDAASTAGMLGFVEVTRRCRDLPEATGPGEAAAVGALRMALDAAITRIECHLATASQDAAAA